MAQQTVEVGSEFIFLAATITLQQFNKADFRDDQKAGIEVCFLVFISMLVLLNLAFVARTLVQTCKDKRRLKQLEAKRKEHEEAVKKKVQDQNALLAIESQKLDGPKITEAVNANRCHTLDQHQVVNV